MIVLLILLSVPFICLFLNLFDISVIHLRKCDIRIKR